MDTHKYDDILYLTHPTSRRHPRMSAEDRAAQFAPFAALTGHGAAIRETARLTEDMVELDDYEILHLDEILMELRGRLKDKPLVSITYFQPDQKKKGGQYATISGRLVKVKDYERRLILEDGSEIPMEHVLDLCAEDDEVRES